MSLSVDSLRPLALNVGLAAHEADWNWQRVSSPFARIYYVAEGSARVSLPQGTVTLRPGHLYLIPPFTIHSCHCDGHFVHYYAHVIEDDDTEPSLLEDLRLPTEVEGTELHCALFRQLCALNPSMTLPQSDPTSYDNSPTLFASLTRNRQRPFGLRVLSRGILLLLIAPFLEQARPVDKDIDKRVRQAMRFVREHVALTVTLDSLASVACLSRDHFLRLFHRETGTTPQQYINQCKMRRAQLLLVGDARPVKEVAVAVGIADVSYFSRLFKKSTGVTPQQYREMNR